MTNSNQNKVKIMTISALLSALGILIPMTFPSIKVEPASFTLASHVPVFIAMFISPATAAFVAMVSALGFFIRGYHIVIVLRALTHLIFALIGAFILQKKVNLLTSIKNISVFSVVISLIHAVAEVAVVTYFYWISGMSVLYYEKGYFTSVILLVGLGTLIHSIIDFSIAIFVWNPLQHIVSVPVNAKVKLK